MVTIFDPTFSHPLNNNNYIVNTAANMKRLPAKLLAGIVLVTVIWFVLMVTYLDDFHIKNHKGQPRVKVRMWNKAQLQTFSEAKGQFFHQEGDLEGEIDNSDTDLVLLVQAKHELELKEQELDKQNTQLENENLVFKKHKPMKEYVDSDLLMQHNINREVLFGTQVPTNLTLKSLHDQDRKQTVQKKKKITKKKTRTKQGKKRSKGRHKKQGLDNNNVQLNTGSLDDKQQTIYVHQSNMENSTTAYVKQNYQLQNEIAISLRLGGLAGANMKRDYIHKHGSIPIPVRSRPKTVDEKHDIEDSESRHSFNVTASEAIALNRLLPDYRPASCPQTLPTLLPSGTVIVCFHNEAWSTLLRSVYSVLDHTPEHVLKEIILVDDASTFDYLGEPLETYLKELSNKILMVRMKERQGLIRARQLGTAYARGDVLIFLDSHCECAEGWVEPLLYSIKNNRKKVVCPEIDIIQHSTFEYVRAPREVHGSFDWNLQFVWKDLPVHEMERRNDECDPVRTPTMIGGLFAIDRQFFAELGQYDDGMDIWGGENIELSFKIWMCGGSIEILPCSRVGHVFRPVIPYGFPAGARKTIDGNAMRVAEVWLDEYKKFFYASTNLTRDPAVLHSVSDRRKLRSNLHCEKFTWYLKYVIPEMTVPLSDAEYFGQVKSTVRSLCLESHGISVTLNPCMAQTHNQMFTLTTSGLLRQGRHCMTSEDIAISSMKLIPCEDVVYKWQYSETYQLALTNSTHRSCLHLVSGHLTLSTCRLTGCRQGPRLPNTVTKCNHYQAWSFTHHFDQTKLHGNYD